MSAKTDGHRDAQPAARRGVASAGQRRLKWVLPASIGAAAVTFLIVWFSFDGGRLVRSPPDDRQQTTEEETSVYASYLTHPYEEGIESLAVSSLTMRVDCDRRSTRERYLKTYLKGISARTIDDFYARNANRVIVTPNIRANLPVTMETQTFGASKSEHEIIAFSRVGFHKSQALLCVDRAWIGGRGKSGGSRFVLLEKDGDAWRVKDSVVASKR